MESSYDRVGETDREGEANFALRPSSTLRLLRLLSAELRASTLIQSSVGL
jgi:hypothetical protein